MCMIELASAVVEGSSSSIHRQLSVRRVELEFEMTVCLSYSTCLFAVLR